MLLRRNAWRIALCAVVLGWHGACGGKAQSERRGDGNGTPGTGGAATGGSAGSTTSGGSSFGASSGVGGSAGAGGNGNAGSGGSAGDPSGGSSGSAGDTAAGSSGGGAGGATGGTSAGGEGGGENCVDVCALQGPACCFPNANCVRADASCTVEVLEARVITFGDYAAFEQSVAALPQDLLLSFTDADIASAAADPAPAARIEFHMTAEFAARHGATLDVAYNRPFRVSCDGRPLFIGVFYMVEGAAAINLPVFHADLDDEGSLVLRLGARLGAWPGIGGTISTESRERIDRAELRGALCLRGPLRELEVALSR